MTDRTLREDCATIGTGLKVSFLSIPFMHEIGQYNIGFWVWVKPDADRHHVFIERRDGIMIAGADHGGERLIAGMWREIQGNPFGSILNYCGKYAANMNADLVDEQITERIWDFIQGQAITMILVVARGNDQRL